MLSNGYLSFTDSSIGSHDISVTYNCLVIVVVVVVVVAVVVVVSKTSSDSSFLELSFD